MLTYFSFKKSVFNSLNSPSMLLGPLYPWLHNSNMINSCFANLASIAFFNVIALIYVTSIIPKKYSIVGLGHLHKVKQLSFVL